MQLDSSITTNDAIQRLSAAASIQESRLRELEFENIKQKHELATLEKQLEKLEVEFVKGQERTRSTWSKIAWLTGGGFLSAIVTWVMKGGLAGVVQ